MVPEYFITPEGYHAYKYARAAITADAVIFGFDGSKLQVLLIRRKEAPYAECWALPGGFMHMNETIEECAKRELQEETGLVSPYMKQLGVFSAVDRDPRNRVVTVAFYALVKMQSVRGGSDAKEARWCPIDEMPSLAFDHKEILGAALERLRQDLHFNPVGFELLPEKFSIPQLQRLYEAILEMHFDRRNFQKKILSTGIITALEEKAPSTRYRASTLYRFDEEQYTLMKLNFRLEF